MSNTATYLNKEDRAKLERIASECNVSTSRALQTIIHTIDEKYLSDIVGAYSKAVNT